MMAKYLFLIQLYLVFSVPVFGQELTSSNLPIFIISTHGDYIRDEPKISADLGIIDNKGKKRNQISDLLDFKSRIGIEIRGSSSQRFPKNSFGFEIRDDADKSSEASLLGLPTDEDWILFASYNEKSLIHNVLAMKMAEDQGMYASRTKYVELVLNGEYYGVYVLMERIKRTASRANVTKMSDKDNTGDAVTGGYIFKIDKTTGSESELGWYSKIPPLKSPIGQKIYFQFDYPKPSNITLPQQKYLQSYVDSAETVLKANNYTDPINGYRKYFDTRSFIGIFLTNEVSKNVDGFRISTFFTKDRASKGGKIKAGPAWDYDLAFANCEYCNSASVEGWSYLYGNVCPNDFWEVPFHWSRMLEDPAFIDELLSQYRQLRSGVWATEKLMKRIDSLAAEVGEAQIRNFTRWPVLGVYVWPNPRPLPATWQAEVNELKSWLSQRLAWLDNHLPGVVTGLEEHDIPGFQIEVLGNPVSNQLSFVLNTTHSSEILLEILSSEGRCIVRKHKLLINQQTNFHENLPAAAGIYILRIHTTEGVIIKKILKL